MPGYHSTDTAIRMGSRVFLVMLNDISENAPLTTAVYAIHLAPA